MQINHGYQSVDVCVLGGGAVGAVAMLLARQQGLSAVQLLPQAAPQTPNAVPRTYAIAPQVQAGLAQLGVWGLLHDGQIQRCEHMRVFWQHGEHVEPLHLSATQAGKSQLCSFVSEHDLLTAIQLAMTATRAVQHQTHYAAQDYPTLERCSEGMRIRLAGQTPLLAKLCIVAEGAGSRAAQQLDAAPTVYDYQHSAVVAVLHSDAQDAGVGSTAWQWLGGDAQGHDVLALLPLPALNGKARYGLVWSQSTPQAQGWAGNEVQMLAAVQARVGSAVGTLSLHGAMQHFPLFKSDAPFFASSASPHEVMVGDTAHKIHPLAGQGLNLGFEDVLTLFEVLAQREPWRSVGDHRLLARYQRRRAASAGSMGALVHAVASRGRWPAWLAALAHKSLNIQNDWPMLGQGLHNIMVNTAARGGISNRVTVRAAHRP